MIGLVLTIILAQDYATTVVQTNRDLDHRLIAIQNAIVKLDIERERSVDKLSAKIDRVDESVGPRLERVALGLSANSDELADLNENMKELVRVSKEVEPIAEDVKFLLRILIWIVGPGGAAWAGKQFIGIGKEGQWLLKRREKPE